MTMTRVPSDTAERFMKMYLTVLVLVAYPLTASGDPAAKPGTLVGRIVEASTQQPLVGANLHLLGTDFGTASGADGSFELPGLREDLYKLEISHIGYNTHIATDVRIIRGKTLDLRDISLEAAVIAGDEVTVAAGYFVEDRERPVSNHQYHREEIRRAPGTGGDIFRALAILPGVSSSGGEFSAFTVRGASPRDNIILVDGIPFDKVAHFEGGSEQDEAQGGRFSIFVPGLINEAKFQSGGFPARFGGKKASYLGLQVKEGNRNSPTVDGRYDLLGWEVNYDGPSYVAANTSVILSARSEDFERILDMIDEVEGGYPRLTDVVVKTTTDLSARNKVSLLGIFAPEKYDREVRHVLATKVPEELDAALWDVEEERYLLGLNWRLLTGSSGFLQTTAYYRGNRRDFIFGRAYPRLVDGLPSQNDPVPVRSDIFGEHQKENEVGLRSMLTHKLDRDTEVVAGFELSRVALDFQLQQNEIDTLYTFDSRDLRPDQDSKFVVVRPEFVSSAYDDSKINAAGYAEMSRTVAEALTLNPGVRYEYSQFNGASTLSPRLSASYSMTPKTRLSFATGVYYQNPQFGDVAVAPANNKLRNEKAYHLIAGVAHYLQKDVRLTTEAYYHSFDNLVVRPDRASELRTNQGTGWTRGIDVSLVKRLVMRSYGQVSYSFNQSRRDDGNGDGEYDSDFNQPHILTLLAGYQPSKEWTFSAKWKYATGFPTTAFIVHNNVHGDASLLRFSQEITADNTDRIDPHHGLNIRADYRKQLGRLALVGFLEIINIYDRLNVNFERFVPETGRIEKYGTGVLPTIGLRLEM